jgi:hypothetical protein
MDYAVDRLVDAIDYEGNKKHNRVACHDIKITIVHCNVDRLVVAARDLGDGLGLGNISKVTGSYSVILSISLGAE